MIDADCYDTHPVPQAVAKADMHRNPPKLSMLPAHVKKRAKKPLYKADRKLDEIYPCDSPSLPSAAIPVEDLPLGEFTPIPAEFIETKVTTFEQPIPEVPPTFEARSDYVPLGPTFTIGGYVTISPVAIPSPIPEPSQWAMLAAGLAILVWRKK